MTGSIRDSVARGGAGVANDAAGLRSATCDPPSTCFDPISLEIMWSRLIGTADEMWTTVLRTAVSTIIGAAQDFGCEILDERGNSLAHSYRSMPVFNLVMPELTRRMLEIFPPEPLRPGDILTTHAT